MGKFILLTFCVLVVYYLINIIYDLFFKKDKSKQKNDEPEIVIFDEDTVHDIQQVTIDDVENITTPSSFDSENYYLNSDENPDDFKYDTEPDLESISNDNQVVDQSILKDDSTSNENLILKRNAFEDGDDPDLSDETEDTSTFGDSLNHNKGFQKELFKKALKNSMDRVYVSEVAEDGTRIYAVKTAV